MSLTQALSFYAALNLLVAVAFVALKISEKVFSLLESESGASAKLKLHYAVLSSVFFIAMSLPLIPNTPIFDPPAKVWSAQSFATFSKDYTASEQSGYLAFSKNTKSSNLSARHISFALLLILGLASGHGLIRLGRDLLALRRIRKGSFLVKRIRRVVILANDQISVPFSYWTPFRATVVIPGSMMSKQNAYKISVAHELQHHRQADTMWVYAMWALKVVCILNPLVYRWNRWLSELQEFACDETLVDRNKVESQQYARCLIEVAESALNQNHGPACATGLVFLVECNLLKRRIEKMMCLSQKSRTKVSRSISWTAGGVAVALMAATAFASQSMIQDRRVTLSDAEAMAAKAKSETGFPIVVNDLVLKELNRFMGTPEGRSFMQRALQRMENYRAMVEAKIGEYHVPAELIAIPIIESGYQNLVQKPPHPGAGIWQFVPSTAKNYGLNVNSQEDDRLNAELLTDAAMRYLKGNQLRFNDWLLSVYAFNIGESRVQEGIIKTGSRDVWTLIRAGYVNDENYLARVMAAVLIMKNPESVAP